MTLLSHILWFIGLYSKSRRQLIIAIKMAGVRRVFDNYSGKRIKDKTNKKLEVLSFSTEKKDICLYFVPSSLTC